MAEKEAIDVGHEITERWFYAGDSPDYIRHANININDQAVRIGGDGTAVRALAHELLHALGINRHVSREFPKHFGKDDSAPVSFEADVNSIMDVALPYSVSRLRHPVSFLHPADREALRALYGRLDNGDSPTDFGTWSDTSTHVHANGEHAAFGVALRNGYAEPWAYGYYPGVDLANNPELAGRAAWSGILLGFTPAAAPVAGDARVSVNLMDLNGLGNFTNLESWAVGEAPSEAGTGNVWGDGDLTYTIAVTGNTFRQTGDDDGILTGAFFGSGHEGMGGDTGTRRSDRGFRGGTR